MVGGDLCLIGFCFSYLDLCSSRPLFVGPLKHRNPFNKLEARDDGDSSTSPLPSHVSRGADRPSPVRGERSKGKCFHCL